MMDAWWITILSNSVIAVAIAVVAWCGTRFIDRPALWHLVWVFALIRLFIPPVFSTPVSWTTAPAMFTTQLPLGASLELDEDRMVSSSPFSPQQAARSVEDPRLSQSDHSWSLPHFSWSAICMAVWGSGSVLILASTGTRIIRFQNRIRHAATSDADADRILDWGCQSIGQSASRIRVVLVDQPVPPLLWPVGKTPSIVIPTSWWNTTSIEERRTVLMHELVHWRRRDHWVRWLQWGAGVVFWWHPVVWIARRELNRLEEECCDAEVMHRMPNSGRSYASALLSAAQWIEDVIASKQCSPAISNIAIPMSESSTYRSFHRRIEMLRQLKFRPWNRRQRFSMLLMVCVPMLVGLSVVAQTPEVSTETKKATTATAILTGEVTDEAGKPLADAKVRVLIPSTEMRHSVDLDKHREIWGRTDEQGRYQIEIDGIEDEQTASIDILHRGHRRLVGTLMAGGDENEVTLKSGEIARLNATLPATLYFAGQVVDEDGKPIEGATVFSSLRSGQGSGGVEISETDVDGRFAVYSYEKDFFQSYYPNNQVRAALSLEHPAFNGASIDRLEDIDADKRDDLRVVLSRGHSIAGVVQRPGGEPAVNLAVSIQQNNEPYERKAVRTDEVGHFRLDGFGGGESTLKAVDVPANQKVVLERSIDQSDLEMSITLEPIDVPPVQTHQVLGMTLTTMTKPLNEAYALGANDYGVMIVDPGKDSARFEIGVLRAGDSFWMVGMETVKDLPEMLDRLITEATSPTSPPAPEVNPSAWIEEDGNAKVRVVYSFSDERGSGTNTQYMRLTPDDVTELKRLRDSL